MEHNLDNSNQNKLIRTYSVDLHYSSDPHLNFHDTRAIARSQMDQIYPRKLARSEKEGSSYSVL